MLALLTEERLLDELLVEQAAKAATASGDGAPAEALVQKGLELVHGVYGTYIYRVYVCA